MIPQDFLEKLEAKAKRLAAMGAENKAAHEAMLDSVADLISEIDEATDPKKLAAIRTLVLDMNWSGGVKVTRDLILAALGEAEARIAVSSRP